jgi:hypothetical protein
MIRIPTHLLSCPKLNLIYVQVPKAANSSIIHCLNSVEKWIDTGITNHQEIHDKVRRFKLIYNEFTYLKYKSFTWFTLTRNPYSRLTSSYLNKVVEPKNVFTSFSNIGVKKTHTFLDFCKAIQDQDPELMNDHIKPQSLIIPNSKMNFIGKMEDINSEWLRLKKIIKNLPNLSMHINKSPQSSEFQKKILCKESINIINDIYNQDFKNFYYNKI